MSLSNLHVLLLTLLLGMNSTLAFVWYFPKDEEVLIKVGDVPEGELSRDSIKVLVWNMYKGRKPSFENDLVRLGGEMDILLLQEAHLNHHMMNVFKDFSEFQFDMATSFILKHEGWVPSGVANGSIVRPSNVFWRKTKYREPIIKTPKMVIFAEYPIEGEEETLLTANIHAINFVSARKLKHQIEQAAEVIEKHKGPVVFGGDFNTWSKKKVRTMKRIMERLGMNEVKFEDDGRMRTFKNIIDYIFVRGLDVKYSKVHGDVPGSDHKAMEVELSLP